MIHRRVVDLDKKIAKIQRSAHTLFRYFTPIHDWLRMRSRPYYWWSAKSYSRVTHWAFLFLYILCLPIIFQYYFPSHFPQNHRVAEANSSFPDWNVMNPTNPPPTNADLYSVHALDATHVWAAGVNGTIIKFNGTSWTTQYSGISSDLYRIRAYDANNVWAVGTGGKIIKTTDGGTTWTAETTGVTYVFEDIAIVKDGANFYAWAVGREADETFVGKIMYYDGGVDTWSEVDPGVGQGFAFFGVTATDTSHVWVSGSDILYYNGVGWSVSIDGLSNGIDFYQGYKIYALSQTNIWLAGKNAPEIGHVYQFNGSSWAQKGTLDIGWAEDIYTNDGSNLWITSGGGNRTWHSSSSATYTSDNGGTSWTFLPTGDNSNAVSGYDNSNVWAVGDSGSILKFNSTNWSNAINTSSSLTTVPLNSITRGNDTNILVVGDDADTATIGKFNGISWSKQYAPTTDVNVSDVYIFDSTHSYAVTTGSSYTNILLDNGNSWGTGFANPTTNDKSLYAIDGVPDDILNTWAVGSQGVITKRTNWYCSGWCAEWQSQSSGTEQNLNDVDALSASNVWAVGNAGTITKYNGSSWAATTSGAQNLNGVYAVAADNVWAVGDSGTILHYNGSAWSSVASGTTLNLNSISGTGANDIWIAGDNGIIMHYNGSWSQSTSPTGLNINKILAVNAKQIWIVGDNGLIARAGKKLSVALPGQTFTSGVGVTGTPTNQTIDDDGFTVTVRALSEDNTVDTSFNSTITLTTNDPAYPALESTVTLVNGVGTGTAKFHTSNLGTGWAISATDNDIILISGSSSNVKINPGIPTSSFFKSSAKTLRAGTPNSNDSPFQVGLKDKYGNETSANTVISLNAVSSSSSSRFGLSNTGPWLSNASLTIAINESTADFHFYDTTVGAYTITVSGLGENITQNVTIIPSDIRLDNAISLAPDSITAGESTRVNILVSDIQGNRLSGRTTILTSSKANDIINSPNPTDGSGNTFGTVTSKTAGISNIIVYDKEDNTYFPSQNLNVSPGPVYRVGLTANKQNLIAGETFNLSIKLYDYYGNIATNTSDQLIITCSDNKSDLLQSHLMTKTDGGIYNVSSIFKTAGNQNIIVSDQSTGKDSSLSFLISPGEADQNASTFTAKDNKLIIGKEETDLVVKITDQFGNAISGHEIVITYDSSGGNLNIDKGMTSENGELKAKYTPKKEGKYSFTAFDKTAHFNKNLELENLPDTLLNQLASALDTPAAKAIANIAQTLVAATAAIGLIPLIANIIGSAPAALHALNYGVSLTLQALGIKKRRKSWGKVYDSTSGKGIDMALVRLYEKTSMKLITTAVTDITGKYNFHPKPGEYILSVSKEGFVFPTGIFARGGLIEKIKEAEEELMERHYIGQTIKIESDSEGFNIDIPIDPIKKKAAALTKVKYFASDAISLITITLAHIFVPVLIIGVVLSVFSTIVIPTKRNMALSTVYIIIAIIYLISRVIKARRFGLVFDKKTRKPIPDCLVSVFDKEYNSLKETRTTDMFGKFSIRVPKGSYYLRVQKNGYAFCDAKNKEEKKRERKYSFSERMKGIKEKNLYHGETLHMKTEGYIQVNVEGSQR